MESINISKLREEFRFYLEYTIMISIVVLFSSIMNMFPIGVRLINALILAVTIISSITLLYVIKPLVISFNKLNKAKEMQQDLEFTLNEDKFDKVLDELETQIKENEEKKNNKSILEILDESNNDYDIEYEFNKKFKRILTVNKFTNN